MRGDFADAPRHRHPDHPASDGRGSRRRVDAHQRNGDDAARDLRHRIRAGETLAVLGRSTVDSDRAQYRGIRVRGAGGDLYAGGCARAARRPGETDAGAAGGLDARGAIAGCGSGTAAAGGRFHCGLQQRETLYGFGTDGGLGAVSTGARRPEGGGEAVTHVARVSLRDDGFDAAGIHGGGGEDSPLCSEATLDFDLYRNVDDAGRSGGPGLLVAAVAAGGSLRRRAQPGGRRSQACAARSGSGSGLDPTGPATPRQAGGARGAVEFRSRQRGRRGGLGHVCGAGSAVGRGGHAELGGAARRRTPSARAIADLSVRTQTILGGANGALDEPIRDHRCFRVAGAGFQPFFRAFDSASYE